MKQTKEILKTLLVVFLLTILTQVGGIIYLIYKPLGIRIKSRAKTKSKNILIRLGAFSGIYIFCSLILVPQIAKPLGRVNLPIRSSREIPLKPANILTVFGNRHYVKPELREVIVKVSKQMNREFPGTQLNYLDGNFPFIDGFWLLPHLSHDDGEKLDLNFLYKDQETGKRLNRSPSIMGYGNVEEPREDEYDQIEECKQRGYWQYDILSRMTREKKRYKFDEQATRELIEKLSRTAVIGKIFVEPHLKKRLRFSSNTKVRYHGCHAVRHDDHIHIQMK